MSISKRHRDKQPPKILFVEGNVLIQEATKNVLRQLGCAVEIVSNGHSALEKNVFDYDLILLDLGLPDISGLDVCKKIRARHRHSSTPIIAYTACGDVMEQPCRAAGVSECVMKLLLLDGFAALLKRHLKWGI